jgi:hypothetical protein
MNRATGGYFKEPLVLCLVQIPIQMDFTTYLVEHSLLGFAVFTVFSMDSRVT